MTETLKAAAQAGLLWLVYQASNLLAEASGLPIPGNVIGVALLFALLCTGIVKLKHVELAADFLLKHLVFFFAAVAVGLMEWWQVFADYGLVLLAAITLSAVLPFLAVGHLFQAVQRRRA